MQTRTDSRPPGAGRWAIAALALGLAAPMLATGLAGFGLRPALALAVAVLALAAAGAPLARRLPRQWDTAFARRPLAALLLAAIAVLAVLRLSGVALYLADAEQAQFSAFWFDPFYIGHSCYSGYWQAAELSREGAANLYDPMLYSGSMGRFKLDEFLYLPQFLLLPRLGLVLGGDFYSLRAVWFALEGAIVLAGLWAAARWIGGGAGRRAWLLIPAVMLSSAVVVTLQVGNFQLAAIALSVLAMIQFERGRNISGGALLGFAAFKLFPGLLGVYLLARRRWAAAAWTGAFAALYTVVAYLWLGPQPFEAFLHYQAPRIANGEAWAFLEIEGLEWVSAINQSVPGLVLKAKILGVEGLNRATMGAVAWIWTGAAIVMAIVAGLRHDAMSRLERAAVWIALLGLAVFRSPFVPDHSGLFAPIWLWSLIAAGCMPNLRSVALLAVAWLACNAVLPVGGLPLPEVPARILLATAVQAIAIGLCLWTVLRRPGLRSPSALFWRADDSQPPVSAAMDGDVRDLPISLTIKAEH
ncbi:glycosyltransferase family 87 protein [Lysobacter firmicutimachus]|uniref:Glycosyltransferase family 87 protein n=1 Tax=Lysobacter firmicutimachus TaxID=1792846 RepID=A0ABU8CXJ9_9GAMM